MRNCVPAPSSSIPEALPGAGTVGCPVPLRRWPSATRPVGVLCVLALLWLPAQGSAEPQSGAGGTGGEVIVGGPCEGCGEVFNGMPEVLADSAVIAPPGEPGERMTIRGAVRRADGSAAPGVIVYAYHTDAKGVYPPEAVGERRASEHGRLRGWVRTGPDGRYAFSTIRPMGYPNGRAPQHVHMHVIEPGRCTYYIDDVMFLDDPRVPAEELRRHARGRGGAAILRPERASAGEWVVTRDIRLGAGIPDYKRCEEGKR